MVFITITGTGDLLSIVRRISGSFDTIALRMVKVSKLAQRKLIPHRSVTGLGAFRKIKYFADIPRQLLCMQGFDHKAKIIQKRFCCLAYSQYKSHS